MLVVYAFFAISLFIFFVNFLNILFETKPISVKKAITVQIIHIINIKDHAFILIPVVIICFLFFVMSSCFIILLLTYFLKSINYMNSGRWSEDICSLSIDLNTRADIFCHEIDGSFFFVGPAYNWLISSDSITMPLATTGSIAAICMPLTFFAVTTIRDGSMNGTNLSVFARQAIVGALYLAPFWLTFLYVPSPFNILAPCLLIIKQKLPSGTDLYEIQVLAKQAVQILARMGTDEDRENVQRIKQTFILGDEAVHSADKDGASAKFFMDTLFHAAEGLSVAAMIVWFVLF